MQKRSPKRRNFSQLAKAIVDEATDQTVSEESHEVEDSGKNPAAVALGHLGGLKGGKGRWKGTTKKQRSQVGRKAAPARWHRAKHSKGVTSRAR